MNFKYVIVGAGISGMTMAERIASQLGDPVLVVEKRGHIGGNCYDRYTKDGILIHQYGPHIFHTQSKQVFDYLSQFTQFDTYQHRVLTYVDGTLMPMPICRDTLNMLFGMSLSNDEVEEFLEKIRVKGLPIETSADVVLSRAGETIYEKFFKEYTKKQWDAYPDQLDPSVISRVPIRSNSDRRYFTDQYQGMPKGGYTAMFERMADHPNIKLLLHTSYQEIVGQIQFEKLIYCGPIDEYFDFRLGRLKYRSVRLEFETLAQEEFQPAAVVNYPNDYDFTRITEYKKLTGQQGSMTVISREYPTWEGEPYYPVPMEEQGALYAKYAALAEKERDVLFLGRLGQYRYYNMDAAVKAALDMFEQQVRK